MLPRGIKVAYLIMMIAAAVVAYIALSGQDELAMRGHSFVIELDKGDDGAGVARVAGAVEAFARDHGVNVGRLYDDPLAVSVRRVYLAVGDPGAESTRWLGEGYPYFSRGVKVEFRPYPEISGVEPDGSYLVYGSERQAQELLQEFRALGYRGTIEPAVSVSRVVRYLGHGALVTFILVVGLLANVTVASAVALNAKIYGIQRLQGRSLVDVLRRDLRQLALFCLVASAVVSAVTAAALYLYNGLHQFGAYGRVALSIAGLYASTALLIHGLTVALLHRSPIVEAINGEVAATWAIAGSYVLRAWSLLLIFSIVTSGITSAWALDDERATYRTWAGLGSAYYLRISAAIEYSKHGAAASEKIGQWIRDADARNEVALASPQTLPGSGREVLVVNNRYLAKHQVYDARGIRVRPGDGRAIRMLVPRRYSGKSGDIEAQVARWTRSVSRPARGATVPQVRMEQVRDGQSLVSYTRLPGARSLSLEAPVVLVVTGASGVISNDAYVTMATTGGILVEDPNRTMRGLSEAGVGAYVLGVSPFARDAAGEFRDARREFGVQVANLVTGIAVLLLTAFSVSVVYCRRNAQALLAKHLHGWGFLRTHWRILALESVVGLTLVLWAWNNAAAAISRHRQPGVPPVPPNELALATWEPVLAGGVAVAGLMLIVFTLKCVNSRFAEAHLAGLA